MVDLDKYCNYQVEYIEEHILPSECKECNEDCGSCDNALLRWSITNKDKLILQRKVKCTQVRRLLRDIERIDEEIEVLDNG